MDEPTTPTVGRIVHYVTGANEHWAAIVTAVHADRSVNLAVFYPDGLGVGARREVRHDSSCSAGTWHWPERT